MIRRNSKVIWKGPAEGDFPGLVISDVDSEECVFLVAKPGDPGVVLYGKVSALAVVDPSVWDELVASLEKKK